LIHFYKRMKMIVMLNLLLLVSLGQAQWKDSRDRVRLQDVQVLTLHQGKMTTGRRSSPVPQLNCVGGSARGMFNPQVVQCYNRGWDGVDVQWECKTDLDMDYRLGSVNVLCEGYDYPDDPYILAGSCGLEYTLELTQHGRERRDNRKQSYEQDSYSYGSQSGSYGYDSTYSQSKWKGLSDLSILGVVGIVIYTLYKTCIDTQEMGDRQYSSTGSDGYPGGQGGGGWSNPGSGSGDYQRGPDYGTGDASCGGGGGRQRGTGAGGGNFWTGAGVGGLLGYMFGARNNTGYGGYNRGYTNYGTYGTGGGWGSGFSGGGASRRSGGGGYSGGSSGSAGTRTASGFGGTTRR